MNRQMRSYGAGVMLVQNYDNGERCEPAIILVATGGRKGKPIICDIPGGRRDPQDTCIPDIASRELREESCNLFLVNTELLKLSPRSTHIYGKRKNQYRCYYVGIQGTINLNEFAKNRLIIPNSSAWKEKTNIFRFYLSDFNKFDLSLPGDLTGVLDVHNTGNIIIKAKTKNCIIECLKILPSLEYHPVTECIESDSFLRGTKCYKF